MTTTATTTNPYLWEVPEYVDYKRHEILSIALEKIGPQSKGSPQVEAYWRGVEVRGFDNKGLSPAQLDQYAAQLEWHGVFTLWCWTQANLRCAWRLGYGIQNVPRRTLSTHPEGPAMGDIVVFRKSWHHAIVRGVEVDENRRQLLTVGGDPLGVKQKWWSTLDYIYCWYPVEPLIVAHLDLDKEY